LTPRPAAAKIAGMFRRKRAKEEAPQQVDSAPSQPVTRANGYVVTELPTYHGLKRKVVVYTSDPSGRIIKTFKR
jgi:hypothetical protein